MSFLLQFLLLVSFPLTSLATTQELIQHAQNFSRAPQYSVRNLPGWEKAKPEAAQKCKKAYQNYLQDGVLRITIALGYHDWPAKGFTLDQETHLMIVDALTSPCKDQLDSVCGFSIVDRPFSNSTVLEKISPYGYFLDLPDPKIRVEIAHSSWSNHDRDNFIQKELRNEQIQTSEITERLFFESISGTHRPPCELCIYMGHSRNGGGPDFRPVPFEWSNKERKPIYSYYLKQRSNYSRLISSLQSRNPNLPLTLALLGCNSLPHFYGKKNRVCADSLSPCTAKSLSDFSSTTGLILSEKLSWPSSRPLYFAAVLESFMGLKCPQSIQANIESINRQSQGKESYKILGEILPKH